MKKYHIHCNELCFLAKDVCSFLGITPDHISREVAKLESKCVRRAVISIQTKLEANADVSKRTSKFTGEMCLLTEAGVYALIQLVRTTYAQDFKRWLNEKVLPSAVRITGNYISDANDVKDEEKKHRDDDEKIEAEPLTDKVLVIDGCAIIWRAADGKIDATALCQSSGKRKDFNDWYRLKRTREFITAVSSATGIHVADLVQFGRNELHEHTFVHRRLAYDIAMWLSPTFAAQVHAWLDELLTTGSVVLQHEKSLEEIEAKHMDRIKALENSLETTIARLDREEKTRTRAELDCEDLKFRLEAKIIAKMVARWKHVNLAEFRGFNSVYVLYVGESVDSDTGKVVHIFKIGRSEDLERRLKTHQSTFEQSEIVFCSRVRSGLQVENNIKDLIRELDIACPLPINDDHTETEVLMTTPDISIVEVISNVIQMCNGSVAYSDNEVLLLTKDKTIAELRAELAEMKCRCRLYEHGIKP